jgi:hypothetical protein
MRLHIFALPSSEFHSSYKALQLTDNIRKTSLHFNETPRAHMSTALVKSGCECWLSLIIVTSWVDSNNYHRISQRTVYLYCFTYDKSFASRQDVLTETYHGEFSTVVCSKATDIFFRFSISHSRSLSLLCNLSKMQEKHVNWVTKTKLNFSQAGRNFKVIQILYVVCFLLGDSPTSEFYMPTFRNTLSVPSSEGSR